MGKINAEELKNLIEPHFHSELGKDEYIVRKTKASKLLTHTRLDIAFKLLYLEMLEYDVNFSQELYKEHIRAFSLGKFTEPGNDSKNSIDNYIEDFHNTFMDIKENGFDGNQTLIPLSKNASIANGAHRVASAIFLDKQVDCVALNSYNLIYDYKFFYQRNITSSMLDMAATTFVEYADNVHIAFIWPVTKSSWNDIGNIIPNIVYQKEMTLNYNGAHNLLSQIYYGEEWLGSVENDFAGSKSKLVECFKTFDPVKIVAFQAESLDEVLKIKKNIREVFNVGKHSIHITDTEEEAIRTARVVFNENSIHFLNYAKPNRYISTHKKIETFKDFIEDNSLDRKNVLLDSSIVLSAYGLREAKDTDYMYSKSEKIKKKFIDIDNHDEVLKYYDEEKNELVYNPEHYFYFNNIKFISFSQLYKMKTSRGEEKDRNDCKMMEALIEKNRLKGLLNKLKQKIFYGQILVRQKIIHLLQQLGLFSMVRIVYRKIKGRQ